MPTAHPLSPTSRRRRGGRSVVRRSTTVVLFALVTACGSVSGSSGPAVTDASGQLSIGDETIELQVQRCATFGGRFAPSLPVEAAETTLTATGRTGANEPVEVVARRTRSTIAPHVVHSVEVTIGDPTRHVEALVLYRAFDEHTERWTTVDPDAATTRVDADGPLLRLHDGQVEATGVARRPPTGDQIDITLQADCPIETDEGPGLAHQG